MVLLICIIWSQKKLKQFQKTSLQRLLNIVVAVHLFFQKGCNSNHKFNHITASLVIQSRGKKVIMRSKKTDLLLSYSSAKSFKETLKLITDMIIMSKCILKNNCILIQELAINLSKRSDKGMGIFNNWELAEVAKILPTDLSNNSAEAHYALMYIWGMKKLLQICTDFKIIYKISEYC